MLILFVLQSYSAALQVIPGHAETLLNRAAAYMKLKKNYEALQVRACILSSGTGSPTESCYCTQDLNACTTTKPDLELAHFRKGYEWQYLRVSVVGGS